MKHFILTMLAFIMAYVAVAQTQQGIVKTKGRLNGNGSVTPGLMLQGATVKVKGRTVVVSNAQGAFSFPVPGDRYSIESVKKNGYQLVDPDATSRQYSYSANPLMIVMETPDDRADEELANERKIRRSLQRQLIAKEDEIEQLREENRISQEEYRSRLQELYARQETSEKLISKMVEYYSQIDYDQIDEFNRRISSYILNGELTRADSMLATKGDINSRVAALRQHQKANAEEQAELDRRQQALSQSRAYAAREVEDLAQDCHHKYEIMKMQYRNDSAAYYIKLRASLDTANAEWQIDAADYLTTYLADYDHALQIYQNSSHIAATQGDDSGKAMCMDGMGRVWYLRGNYKKAFEYCQKSLDIRKRFLGETHIEVAGSIAHIGLIYDRIGDYARAVECCSQALDMTVTLLGTNSATTAIMLGNLGVVYESQGEYDKAIDCLNKELEIEKTLGGETSVAVANCYNNIGVAQSACGNYDESVDAYQKALAILTTVYGLNHPDVSTNYNNMGVALARNGEYEAALEYFLKALEISKAYFGENHPTIATRLSNIGGIYYFQGRFDDALECYEKSLEINTRLLGDKHPDVAEGCANMASVYEAEGDFDMALAYYDMAYLIYCDIWGEKHPAAARCLVDKGEVYYSQGNYGLARKCAETALKNIDDNKDKEIVADANDLLEKTAN